MITRSELEDFCDKHNGSMEGDFTCRIDGKEEEHLWVDISPINGLDQNTVQYVGDDGVATFSTTDPYDIVLDPVSEHVRHPARKFVDESIREKEASVLIRDGESISVFSVDPQG